MARSAPFPFHKLCNQTFLHLKDSLKTTNVHAGPRLQTQESLPRGLRKPLCCPSLPFTLESNPFVHDPSPISPVPTRSASGSWPISIAVNCVYAGAPPARGLFGRLTQRLWALPLLPLFTKQEGDGLGAAQGPAGKGRFLYLCPVMAQLHFLLPNESLLGLEIKVRPRPTPRDS